MDYLQILVGRDTDNMNISAEDLINGCGSKKTLKQHRKQHYGMKLPVIKMSSRYLTKVPHLIKKNPYVRIVMFIEESYATARSKGKDNRQG